MRSPSDSDGSASKKTSPAAENGQIVKEINVAGIKDELGFAKWYNSIEDDLLDASYGDYQYAQDLLPPARPWD
jgi:hypothetical protein